MGWREARDGDEIPSADEIAVGTLSAAGSQRRWCARELAVAAGGWFYYNAHVMNVYRTTFAERDRAAEYERRVQEV